ncbi:hypothetical protein FHX74_001609 [Friedmanniella endophytica]|uniref:DUF4244 domain-containing protein n=1 Tax=Microlunatus kandeliicorticis TaxID=1759536 RepID=A0A7W3IRN4_9ACTN|nr:DUF4244 domain-containing protein [Microlunatus kandeliicorticis]MBA8794004.1 hypothetical protein [Microlunatus kandeliicorticis]
MSTLITTGAVATDAATETPRLPAVELPLAQRMVIGCLAAVIGLGRPLARDQRGITTVEYVIGIVAGITIVGVLVLALSNPSVQHALVGLIEHLFGMGADPAKQVKKG